MGTSVAFYFSGHPNFAANQSVTVMEIITFESKAYKELDNKITAIADYIFNHMETARQSEEDMWVDSYEVCTFLKISEKTLQRLRVSGTIAYSNIRGRLAEQYGYRDGGECLTVADKRELWFFEITGAGPEDMGALWVARRIPDNHVTVSANTPRISDVDFGDKDNYMYSEGLKEKARKLGYWDGKEPFKFWKVIHETGKKPFTIRDFFVLKTLAPSLNLTMDMEELPLSVKPEQNVSLADMNRLLRETYEGTEWDMTKDMMVTKKIKDKDGTERDTIYKSPLAQNWMTNDMFEFLNAQRGEKKIEKQRTISVVWCAYSFVIQCRDWLPDEVGGVCWWSEDNPGESPRVPLFAGMTDVPESFKVCGHKRYRPDAALWTYRRTNRLAQVSWGHGRKLIEPAVLSFEQKAADEMPLIENKVSALIREGKKDEAQAYLTRYSFDFIYSTLRCWEEMEGQLWHKFGRGF